MFRVLTIALIAFSSTSAQTWHIDDQPLHTSISALPAQKRAAILRALKPSLHRDLQSEFLDADELDALQKSLHIEEVTTPSGPILLVQGWGTEMCGAVGNCAVWVLDKNDRLILDRGVGKRVTVSRTLRHGLPDIVIASHMSASEENRVTYGFNGTRYRLLVCVDVNYADAIGNRYKYPHATPLSCAGFEHP
jgi:hypothetical protein